MGEKRQRQDVSFLALTVAVLAIAVALFVGIRSLPGRRAAKPESETPAQAAVEKPVAAEPPGSPEHDPFESKPTPAPVTARPEPGQELKLAGIVQGKSPLAVIRRGERRYYVRVGSEVSGYRLAEIRSDRVVLTKGAQSVTLRLHEPVTEDEGEVVGGPAEAAAD